MKQKFVRNQDDKIVVSVENTTNNEIKHHDPSGIYHSWKETPRNRYVSTVMTLDTAFTSEECEWIIKLHKKWKPQKSEVEKGGHYEYDPAIRNITIYAYASETENKEFEVKQNRDSYVPKDPENSKTPMDIVSTENDLFLKLDEVITAVNREVYHFDIKDMMEIPTLMKYDSVNKGHFDFHIDIGYDEPACWRKLGWSLMLNDDFEGGNMEIKTGGNSKQVFEPQKCRLTIFPSYLLHCITPVTSGIRWGLVGFHHGPPFR